MFKCTECGTEYEIKPDYCDCGNDTFEEIKPAVVEPVPAKVEKIPEPKPQPKVKPQHTKTFSAPKVDPISLSIFLACIVLSFIILFFVGNPKEQTEEEKVFEETTITDIPKIDKFWNNSTVGVVSDKQEPVEQPVVQQVQQIVQKVITPQTPKPVQKIQTPKVTTKPKTTAKPAVQKPATQTTKPQTTTQTTQKPATTTTPKIPQTTLNVTQNQQTTQPQTTTKPATTTQQTQPKTQTNTAAAQQELSNYKISLRNTIGRKIDFTKVIGDGNCAITFKINSSGQLTNRAFSKYSGNITLNDAVYNAMKATPSFSAPPASYKGETMTLTIKFTNGNFAITLN